ncbi:MAG: hypothetical protein A2275_14115 [Bacteroidetes bacterium RIFOXYA12_FULL_35_11]|nr:MAG: hypothetical protein A2X01_09760 [Bacteroidetes bacterium GWF2_35_48]OFY73493.1 MAG: hypothetical protein A2275_14115 [Bacteroidetes bacterium RIFOXYA12_FULL_35_11]OFY92977.1 MAG: hypothetical protein A2491_04725 [Bacteroidetes bacterium RIFOXYC12_FULL_35_7]
MSFALFAQDDFYNATSVHNIRITFKERNWDYILDSLYEHVGEDGRLIGDIIINEKLLKKAGIRYKGNSSHNSLFSKNPFNIDLDYCFEDQNYGGYKKIKLSNVIHDPSFVREAIAYHIAGKYMPVPKSGFANVYVNDTLIGLYSCVEAIDKAFVKKHFGSKSNPFFKGAPENFVESPLAPNSNLGSAPGTDTTAYQPFYKMESDTGWLSLVNFIQILNNNSDNIENVLNVDRALWMHALNYSILNLDSYIGYAQNYYLYMDEHGRYNTIPWDMNMSFGSFRYTDGTSVNTINIENMKKLNPLKFVTFSSPTFPPRPLIKNLIVNSTYRKMFMAHIRTIMNENIRNSEYFELGKSLQNILEPYVLNDTNKFYSHADFINNIDSTVRPAASPATISSGYPGIKNLMDENGRLGYLETVPGFCGSPVISQLQSYPSFPEKNQQTYITTKISDADSVVIFYRFSKYDLFQKVQMFDDGNHNDELAGDSIFGASIFPEKNTIQYFIWAENDSAGIFSPERAEYEFHTIFQKVTPGTININELFHSDFLAENNWIELYNTSPEKLNLKNLFLSDDKTNRLKWALPDTSIEGFNYFLINKTIFSDLFLSEISSLYLSYSNDLIIDELPVAHSLDAMSIGRYPNGTGAFVYMEPSPAKYNLTGNIPSLTSEFEIFPNPAHDKLFITFAASKIPESFELISVQGETLAYSVFSQQENASTVILKEIDIRHLTQGVYFIKVIYPDKIKNKKCIIQ